MELKDLSLKQIIEDIKSGKISQKEVYDYFLGRIKVLDPQIEAFNYVNEEFQEKDKNSLLA